MSTGYSIIKSAYIEGANTKVGLVETDIKSGLPNITVVGLPDQSVKEAKERIRSALLNAGFRFPRHRITVNLSPGGTKKEGTHFDLPIAVGILLSSEEIKSKIKLDDIAFIGELSLDGKINHVYGVTALAIGLEQAGIKKICLPKESIDSARFLKDIEIIPIDHIKEIKNILEGKWEEIPKEKGKTRKKKVSLDYRDVLGQEDAKRAMEIAAAGFHNVAMIGPPGSGKTMLARRLPSIMAEMSYGESLEITKIMSLAGHEKSRSGLVTDRPFRDPHHSITPVALAGGGVRARPGEISMAHNGILFLDEFPEFQRRTLEILRQPMEDGYMRISRASATIAYPSKFMLVAAMNPCPCGYYGHGKVACNCSEYRIKKYLTKISGPLLDRIDMFIEIYPPSYVDIQQSFNKNHKKNEQEKSISSKEMKATVKKAVKLQELRYKNSGISFNSELTPKLMEKYCNMDKESMDLLKKAYNNLHLSHRAHHKIIKLARTIADLENSKDIKFFHVAEAIRYNRGFDKNE